MPTPIGVAGGVRKVGGRQLLLLLQGKTPNRQGSRWLPLRQGSPGEDPPKEVHVRLHPKEGLTDSDEASDVQHPNRIEVLQLQAPLVEKPTQELVREISKPALVEGEEGDNLIGPRSRNSLPRRRSPPVRHLLRWEQPLLGEGGQHRLVHIGWPPAQHRASHS